MLTTKAVNRFQRNLITSVEKVSEDTTPQAYVEQQIVGLEKAGVQRKEGRPAETLKLGDKLEGLLTEQIITGADGEQVRQMQLVCIDQGQAFTVIASHLDGASFESVRQEFRAMLTSFQTHEGAPEGLQVTASKPGAAPEATGAPAELEAALIKIADEAVAKDKRINKIAAARLLTAVKEKGKYTPAEKATLEHLLKNYAFAKDASAWVKTQLKKWRR